MTSWRLNSHKYKSCLYFCFMCYITRVSMSVTCRSKHFALLSTYQDVSSVTPIIGTYFIYYVSIPYFCYVFRCISHHLQGELTCTLLKTICLYTSVMYSGCGLKYKGHNIVGIQQCVQFVCFLLFCVLQTFQTCKQNLPFIVCDCERLLLSCIVQGCTIYVHRAAYYFGP